IERQELEQAIAHCDRALIIYQDVSDEVGRGEALRWRACALARANRMSDAQADVQEALRIAIRAGARLLEAESARDLGLIRLMRGDKEAGARDLTRALALFTKLGARREAEVVRSHLPRPTPSRSLSRISRDPSR
ncbi:MAG: hypothetical protein JWL95_2581, partial [Gemmatimonadetes bacterium]|nr:hypothetical protein [Gemmatimonadota bacterium]